MNTSFKLDESPKVHKTMLVQCYLVFFSLFISTAESLAATQGSPSASAKHQGAAPAKQIPVVAKQGISKIEIEAIADLTLEGGNIIRGNRNPGIIANSKITGGQITKGKITLKDEQIVLQINAEDKVFLGSGTLETATIQSADVHLNLPSSVTTKEGVSVLVNNQVLSDAVISSVSVIFGDTSHKFSALNTASNYSGKITIGRIESAKQTQVSSLKIEEAQPSWYSTDGNGYFKLSNPGYFDVGGGLAHIVHTTSAQQSATGFLLTLKAYPLGRWYAPIRKPTREDLLTKVTADPNNSLNTFADYMSASNSNELFAVEGRDHWYNKMSIFWGRSMGAFDTATHTQSLDAMGIQYDIAPEYAVMIGEAFYRVENPGLPMDTRHHFIFGIQMNLNAFSGFRNIGGNPSGY